MTQDEQFLEADDMHRSGSAERELRIRELAQKINEMNPNDVAMQRPIIPIQTSYQTLPPGSPLSSSVSLAAIEVNLHPSLIGTPEGLLIAEIIIRDAWDLATMDPDN